MQWMVMLNKDGTKSICHSDLNDYLDDPEDTNGDLGRNHIKVLE